MLLKDSIQSYLYPPGPPPFPVGQRRAMQAPDMLHAPRTLVIGAERPEAWNLRRHKELRDCQAG